MPLVRKNPFQTAALPGFSLRSLVILIASILVIAGAIVIAFYFYIQYHQTKEQLTKISQANNQGELIAAVGKLILLPTDEEPTIATVSDIKKLRGQSFFVHAKNGDKVLIFEKTRQAILYDPFANKIIEVGPISLPQTPAASSSAIIGASAKEVRIALFNGTTVVGLAAKKADILKKEVANSSIVIKADAQKTNYIDTIVYDATGKFVSQAVLVSKILNGKIGTLPKGELKPKNADLVVILGK